MAFNPKDMIYRSHLPDIEIPEDLDIHTFMFNHRPSERPDPTNKTWLIDGVTGKKWTFGEINERCENMAKVLKHEFNIGYDDVVAIFSSNAVDFPLLCWAAFRVSGIVTPANPSYTSSELKYQINLVNKHHPVKVLFISKEAIAVVSKLSESEIGLSKDKIVVMAEKGEAGFKGLGELLQKHRKRESVGETKKLGPNGGRNKLAFLNFSSGTTGLPKAVEIPHACVVSNVLQVMNFRGSDFDHKTDVALGVLPFYHIYALVVLVHFTIFMGVPLTVMPKFNFEDMLKLIVNHRINILFLVPPQLVLIGKNPIADNYDLKHVKFVMTGAAPLSRETAVTALTRIPNAMIGQGYGMTETCTVITFPTRPPIEYGSAGALVPNTYCKIVDPSTGKLLPPGERGELWSKSPANAKGYLGNVKATKETFDDEGYVHTGDEGYFDDAGLLFITDRIKELIKSKGMQVAPAELEGHLLQLDYVQDAGVIGIKDDFAGEVPRAYVVLTPPTLEKLKSKKISEEQVKQNIKKHVEDHKIKYKWLTGGVEFIDVIPKNPSGKILRKELRALASKDQKPKL